MNDTKTEVSIKGKQFLPGARVIVGGNHSNKDFKIGYGCKGQGITG